MRSLCVITLALTVLSFSPSVLAGPPLGGPVVSPTVDGSTVKKVDIKTNTPRLDRSITTYTTSTFKDLTFKIPSTWSTRNPIEKVIHAGKPDGDWFFEIEVQNSNPGSVSELLETLVSVYQGGDKKAMHPVTNSTLSVNFSLTGKRAWYTAKNNLNGDAIYVHFVAFKTDNAYYGLRFQYKEGLHDDMKPVVEAILSSIQAR